MKIKRLTRRLQRKYKSKRNPKFKIKTKTKTKTKGNMKTKAKAKAGITDQQILTNNFQLYNVALQEILRGLDNIKYNNYLIDLEKEITHCRDRAEKKQLLIQAKELHKQLYPHHKHYNKFFEDLARNIEINRSGRFTITS